MVQQWLGSFVIFQGVSRTVLLRKPIFCDFTGGGPPVLLTTGSMPPFLTHTTGKRHTYVLLFYQNSTNSNILHVRIQRGDRGSGPPPPPPENHKNIGFLSNTGPDPLEITKLQI